MTMNKNISLKGQRKKIPPVSFKVKAGEQLKSF